MYTFDGYKNGYCHFVFCMIRIVTLIGRWAVVASLVGGLTVPVYAQTDLPPLPLSQLQLPGGWQLVGSVASGPEGGALKLQPGNTIATGTNQPLTLVTATDDFRLRFDALMTANAGGVLTLPGGQSISLDHSLDLPRLLKAPGLWQTIELSYKTGGTKGPAVLEKLALNGVTVREGQVLTGKATGPVTLMAANGTIAVRNIGYRVLTPRTVAQWTGPLSYTIYEGQIEKRGDQAGKKILKQDTVSVVNYEVAYGQPRWYSMAFSGKLNALQAGEYQFDMQQGGFGGLRIDGKDVIADAYRELGQTGTGKVTLTAGPHDVQVFFARSWPRPGLGVFVSQAGTRPQPLHALVSLPDPDPVGVVSVQAESKPQLIRSFVRVPGEKIKRTHSLSVGSPSGIHYTIDLNQMALLQAWKGDFANVTEMWHERGEPQLLSPMGATIHLPAQTALMVLTNETTSWPDSVDENTLQYKGIVLDKQGLPTVEYVLAGATVTDAIRPEANGLSRTLTLAGSPDGTAYCRVVAGASVEEVGKGLYAINDRSYYVRFDPKAKVKMRQSNGKQELLLPVSLKDGKGAVQYSVVF